MDSEISFYLWDPQNDKENQVQIGFEVSHGQIIMWLIDYTQDKQIRHILSLEETTKVAKKLRLMADFLEQTEVNHADK